MGNIVIWHLDYFLSFNQYFLFVILWILFYVYFYDFIHK
jgi:hypothetical protein